MISIKEQIDEFAKKHPSHREKLEEMKEVFLRIRLQSELEVDNFFLGFDTANLYSPLNHNFKYRLVALDRKHRDHRLLEKSLKPPRPSERDQDCKEFMKMSGTNYEKFSIFRFVLTRSASDASNDSNKPGSVSDRQPNSIDSNFFSDVEKNPNKPSFNI